MATYRELRAQADALMQQAENARQAELQAILDEVRARVAEYGLTPDQVFGRGPRKARAVQAGLPPKYRDPKTGATWSGRGREPAWIKGKRRDRFLIEA